MNCSWADVGSWTALEGIIPADADGNVNAASQTLHVGSKGTLAVSEEDHLIATLGVEDLVIVHTKDATLICKKHEAQRLKDLVAQLQERYGDTHL
jgi:mannose-1-phosphate guanylyltransferase